MDRATAAAVTASVKQSIDMGYVDLVGNRLERVEYAIAVDLTAINVGQGWATPTAVREILTWLATTGMDHLARIENADSVCERPETGVCTCRQGAIEEANYEATFVITDILRKDGLTDTQLDQIAGDL